jgi:hypothetical protein
MGFELTTLVVIGTDCMGSCKSNYHTYMIMTTTATFSKNVVAKDYCYWLCDVLTFQQHAPQPKIIVTGYEMF